MSLPPSTFVLSAHRRASLGANNIGPEGGKAISLAVKHSRALTSLNMGSVAHDIITHSELQGWARGSPGTGNGNKGERHAEFAVSGLVAPEAETR